MGPLAPVVAGQLRARWRAVAALALLVAIAGALVLATAAGARRTGSAYDRFREATATRDASVQIDSGDVDASLDAIEALDIVAAAGRLELIPVAPVDGSVRTEVDLALMAPVGDRWGAVIDRSLVLDGRAPRPDAPGEALINELAAEQAGLGVGDRITVAPFTPAQLQALHGGAPFEGFGGPEVELEVVGIGRQASDLQGADVAVGGMLTVTPALQRELDGEAGALGGLLAVDLVPGATVDQLQDEVRAIVGPDAEFDVTSSEDDFGASLRQATGVLARALAAFALVAAAETAVAVGGTLSRQLASASADAPTLAALGCDRRQRRLIAAAVPGAGAALGAVLAVPVAALASGAFPFSVARRIEPDPGVRPDAVVLAAGGLLLVAGSLAWLLASLRRVERAAVATPAPRWSPTSLALPPLAAIGVGHAFDRRSDGRGAPVRAALAAAVLGVVGVLGAATVVRSFDALLDDPARYGWTWSAEPDLYTDDPEALVEELAAEPGVAAVATRQSARLELDDTVVEAVAFEDHHGRIRPARRAGRLPEAPDEVALGQHTADELDVALGDRITARDADGGSVDVSVVGIVVIAPVESTDPAQGAFVTPEGMERLRRSDGFRSLLVRYEPGFDPSGLEASLGEREIADFSAVYARPRPSSGLEDLDHAMPIVVALGGFFVLLAIVGVGHATVLGARRRRRELATLQALGMRRRQVRGVVVAGALATIAAGLVVGVPLGLALGRVAWRIVIGGQGLVDAPAVPASALAAVLPGAVAVALLVSWRPGTRAARRPVAALRAE